MFSVGSETCKHIIHLYHYENHFCVITSMPGFFSQSFYCETYKIPYQHKEDHRCYNKCSSCYHSPPCYRSNIITCVDCGRLFKSQKCLENHKRKYQKDEKQLEKDKQCAVEQIGSKLEKRKNGSTSCGNKRLKTNNNTVASKATGPETEEINKMPDNYNLSICERFKRCKLCFKQFSKGKIESHKCGFRKCHLCKQEVEAKSKEYFPNKKYNIFVLYLFSGHYCFMQPYESAQDEVAAAMDLQGEEDADVLDNFFDAEAKEAPEAPAKSKKEEIVQRFVFFDFETTQEKVVKETALGEHFEHVPNVCIARVTCDDCRNRDFDALCGRCGESRRIFTGEKCVSEFCQFLFCKNMRNTTAIAHNASGFDSHFILQYLYDQGIAPKIFTNGKWMLFIIKSFKVKLVSFF